MIKLNLLPAHFLERRRVKSLLRLLAVVLVAELALLGFYMINLGRQVRAAQANLADATARAQVVLNLESQAQSVRSGISPLTQWTDFADNVARTNQQWAKLLSELNKWVYEKVALSSMSISGSQVSLVGATDNMKSVAKYYLTMLNNQMLVPEGVVLDTVVPSWSGGTAARPMAGTPALGAAGYPSLYGPAGAPGLYPPTGATLPGSSR